MPDPTRVEREPDAIASRAFAPVFEALGQPGSIELLPTPALICEVSRLQSNIERMQALAQAVGFELRPHFKSHKTALIARRQVEAGAVGISCAKISEAEALVGAFQVADVLPPSILLTSPIRVPALARRVADLANSCDVAAVVDDVDAIMELSSAARSRDVTVGELCDEDDGLHRSGVREPRDAAAIADAASTSAGLAFLGVQGYAGHAQHIASRVDRRRETVEAAQRLRAVIEELERGGFSVPLRTGGGTGTWMLDADDGVLNELQVGSYVFMDREYADALANDPEDCFERSLFVLTSVVSARQDGFVTVDAGLKALATDAGSPSVDGVGARRYTFFGDEHGLVTNGELPQSRVGDRLRLLPGHCDPTVNLYDLLWLVESDRVIGCTPVTARGCSY